MFAEYIPPSRTISYRPPLTVDERKRSFISPSRKVTETDSKIWSDLLQMCGPGGGKGGRRQATPPLAGKKRWDRNIPPQLPGEVLVSWFDEAHNGAPEIP